MYLEKNRRPPKNIVGVSNVGSILNKYKTPTRFGGLERKNKRRRELKMRRDKGITLIALIITIVVMLILVAVSVNVIVNSDLIGHAEKIGDAYKNAVAEEEGYNPTFGNGKTLDDYMEATKPLPEGAGKRADKTKKIFLTGGKKNGFYSIG